MVSKQGIFLMVTLSFALAACGKTGSADYKISAEGGHTSSNSSLNPVSGLAVPMAKPLLANQFSERNCASASNCDTYNDGGLAVVGLFTSQTSIADDFEFSAPGTYKVSINAKGTQVAGVAPSLQLEVDGVAAGVIDVYSTNMATYILSIPVTAGAHKIAIVYINDAQTSTEDRNLILYDVLISN